MGCEGLCVAVSATWPRVGAVGCISTFPSTVPDGGRMTACKSLKAQDKRAEVSCSCFLCAFLLL